MLVQLRQLKFNVNIMTYYIIILNSIIYDVMYIMFRHILYYNMHMRTRAHTTAVTLAGVVTIRFP